MTRNFSDHSANERTFLAWVRTSLPLWPSDSSCKSSTYSWSLSLRPQQVALCRCQARIAVLALIVLGTAMVGIAAARFVMTAKNIDREDLGAGNRIANRHRTCRAARPSGLRSIPLSVAGPCNEALRDVDIFKSSYYQDFSLSEWLAHTPPEFVIAHLRIDRATFGHNTARR
jgi:putative membrane protein